MVVYDAKRTLDWPGYKRFERLRKLVAANPLQHPHVIYRPHVREFGDPFVHNAFFKWVFERRNCTVYVDELYLIMREGGIFPYFYHACVAQGRERRIEVWSATQRPFRIPVVILSESEHFFIFRLQDHDSRKRMEEVSGLDEEVIATLPKRQFYYVPVGSGPQGPLKLRLPGR